MANLVQNPYPIITDSNGDPLEDGYVFIGEPGLSPITNPLQAYWDAGLTNPATNIRTKGGYFSNGTMPGRIYTATNYSILVQDRNKVTIYTQLDSVDYVNSASGSLVALVDTIAELRGLALANPDDQASVGGSVSVGDGLMGPLYYWDATSAEVDNGVSIIQPTATVGNGRWLWINTNAPIEAVNISASGTLSLNFMNRIFLVDTALAITLAIPDGDFQGQNIQLSNDGVSTLEFTGTGIPSSSFIEAEALLTWIGTQWSIIYRGAISFEDLTISNDLTVGGSIATDTITENTTDEGISFPDIVKWNKYYKGTAVDTGDIYTAISSWVPLVGDYLAVTGQTTIDDGIVQAITRTSSTQIVIVFINLTTPASPSLASTTVATPPGGGSYDIEIMANFDGMQ